MRSSVRLNGRTRGWKAGLLDEGGFGFAWMGGVRGGLDGRGLEGDELCGMEGKEKIRCLGVSVLAQSFRLKQILWLKLRRLRWLKGCS